MVRKYFLVYLIYGFSMINMGIFCLKEKEMESNSPSLLKSLKYLGWFGITHGISEWVTLVSIASLYPEYNDYLYHLIQILKAVSFAFLMLFGLDLLPVRSNYKKIINKIPMVLFIIGFSGYLILIRINGLDYHMINTKYNIITMRYLLALLGSIIAATTLFLNSNKIEKQKNIRVAKRYKQLAWVILINGLLEGLLVKEANFFPANIINRELFKDIFGIQILFLKAIVGLLINYLLVKVIDTFSWEQEERLKKLKKRKIASEERRKLGLEIHDSIIQSLYAAGLKLEYIAIHDNENNLNQVLNSVKDDLNNTIDKTREFMSASVLDIVELEDLNENIERIVEDYTANHKVKINYKSEISPLIKGYLSPEKSTQIYYIVQEAICNIIKHSKASSADIVLTTNYDMINISIIDDGIGIKEEDLIKYKHFGIKSMKERSESIGGTFIISGLKKGTMINVEVPWEE